MASVQSFRVIRRLMIDEICCTRFRFCAFLFYVFPLQECYFPLDDGENYQTLAAEDFCLIAKFLARGFLIVDGNELKALHLQPGLPTQHMSIDSGLRKLRAYPTLTGILTLSGHFSYLEAAWKVDNNKKMLPGLEGELILALLRARGKRHVAFW